MQNKSLKAGNKPSVLIIGAGVSGLASAALLAKNGHEVTLIEKNYEEGGRAITWKSKGFIFDMGPSWYLMPEVFDKYFKEFNKKTSDFYELIRLNPSYRIFFEDEEIIDVPTDLDSTLKLFDSFEENGAKKLRDYLSAAELKYNIAMKDFMYKEYNTILDFFTPSLLIDGPKLHVFDSVDKYARLYFKSDKARKILEYSMVFLGGSPNNTPALYSIMSHVDLKLGVWYPYKGLCSIPRAFRKLGEENGVKFIFNSPVEKIIVDPKTKKATGVLSKKKIYKADIIVSGADYPHTEMNLLDKEYCSYDNKYWEKRVMAPSAILIYLGFNKRIKGLKHHNLFLAKDWDKHFREIFDEPAWPKRPSYYVGCPSKTDKTVAPRGCENVFVLVPVATGLNDSEVARKRVFDFVIKDLEKNLGEELSKNIVVKRVFSQKDFIKTYNAYKGTALGIAHTLFQTAVFRPSHKSKKVKNLYYLGNYTHPGIGVPISLISAQIVSKLIEKECSI